MTPGVREYLLAFADDEHLMGQQHTEWIGVAPFLEEDLAFSSIGQDELGHAVMLYELVLELDGVEATDAAVDALAYERSGEEYRSSHLAEYATRDWAEALVRHWIYDAFEHLRWQAVEESALAQLAQIAARAEREETFHRRHADALLDSLLHDRDAHHRMMHALRDLMPLVPDLLDAPAGEEEALAQGVVTRTMADLADDLTAAIAERFDAELDTVEPSTHDRLERSDDFAPLMARMREVFDLDPAAIW
ncbi:MAG: 1,2-phenylacetyl-CoA epoxidase subunit PaaC [Acidimicrobiales bacterium]